jgi:hypothetical protein
MVLNDKSRKSRKSAKKTLPKNNIAKTETW